MASPLYFPNWTQEPGIARLLAEVPWRRDTETRQEAFMTAKPYTYQYGSGRGVRSYTSTPFCCDVEALMQRLNVLMDYPYHWGPLNGCFLNRYDDQTQHLGWHADNFVGMDHTRPVVVVSFGQPREIWFRENGKTGVVPEADRQLLCDGSLLIMPPGFQHTHQHRIPRGDRSMGPRVSLTFRAFKDV